MKALHIISGALLVLLGLAVCVGLVGMSFGWTIWAVMHYYPAWLGLWCAVGAVWVWTTQ